MREVRTLPEVDATELAICAEEVEALCERHREVARLLNGDVAAEHETAPPLDADAREEGAHRSQEGEGERVRGADLVEVELPRDETDLATGARAHPLADA